MGDIVDEIIAEPEEPGFLESLFLQVHLFVTSYGWYILLGSGAVYYLFSKFGLNHSGGNKSVQTEEDLRKWQEKEEQRLKAVQRLQERYNKEAAIQEEKRQEREEKKRQARLAELESLTKGARTLNDPKSQSLRPEYNPLMGDSGSSNRVCFRRPGGGASG